MKGGSFRDNVGVFEDVELEGEQEGGAGCRD